MKLDLTVDMHVYDLKTSVVERFQQVDVIVNCAGIKLDGDVEKTFPQDFDYTLDLNLRASFAIIKNLAGFLKKGGCIINMSCLYGTRPCCGMISYAMSKAGLEGLTRYAAAEFAPYGHRVNAVTACPVETNSMRYVNVPESEIDYFKKKMENNIPLGRIARPDDIVKVVAFLASSRSKKITGQVIKVDGGRALTSSGYIHYKGMKNMNTRFEPDHVNLSTWLSEIKDKFNFGGNKTPSFSNKEDLKKYIEEKMNESNFTSRLSDAHLNVNPKYKVVDINDKKLKDKFLGGNTPNPLYDKKEEEKAKRSTYGRSVQASDNRGRYTGYGRKEKGSGPFSMAQQVQDRRHTSPYKEDNKYSNYQQGMDEGGFGIGMEMQGGQAEGQYEDQGDMNDYGYDGGEQGY